MNKTEPKPDFVNAEGTKWWINKTITDYARQENQFGIRLMDVTGWIVETLSGYKTFLLTENNEIIAESPTLEAVGAKIDVIKFQRQKRKNVKRRSKKNA